MNVDMCTRVRVLHLYSNYTICLRSSVNNNTCLLDDAILRIPSSSGARDIRVSARIARGIRMMASFQRLQKGSHLSSPFYIRQWEGSTRPDEDRVSNGIVLQIIVDRTNFSVCVVKITQTRENRTYQNTCIRHN